MEENKFDPLQFIGFLLISAILMFWFYDNQSSYVENQQDIVVENPIEKFEDNSNTLNLAKEDSNKVELDKKFKVQFSNWISDTGLQLKMKENLKALAKPEATQSIIKEIQQLL